MPKPKTDLNSDIQESRVDLTPKETATLQTANEQLKYTNSPITNNTTVSIPNERLNSFMTEADIIQKPVH